MTLIWFISYLSRYRHDVCIMHFAMATDVPHTILWLQATRSTPPGICRSPELDAVSMQCPAVHIAQIFNQQNYNMQIYVYVWSEEYNSKQLVWQNIPSHPTHLGQCVGRKHTPPLYIPVCTHCNPNPTRLIHLSSILEFTIMSVIIHK